MGNSGGAVTEPVPPEPHIINIASSTRLELDKTRKFSTSNIELKAEGGGNRQETGDRISSLRAIR
jgi:hypothetical protein